MALETLAALFAERAIVVADLGVIGDRARHPKPRDRNILFDLGCERGNIDPADPIVEFRLLVLHNVGRGVALPVIERDLEVNCRGITLFDLAGLVIEGWSAAARILAA